MSANLCLVFLPLPALKWLIWQGQSCIRSEQTGLPMFACSHVAPCAYVHSSCMDPGVWWSSLWCMNVASLQSQWTISCRASVQHNCWPPKFGQMLVTYTLLIRRMQCCRDRIQSTWQSCSVMIASTCCLKVVHLTGCATVQKQLCAWRTTR